MCLCLQDLRIANSHRDGAAVWDTIPEIVIELAFERLLFFSIITFFDRNTSITDFGKFRISTTPSNTFALHTSSILSSLPRFHTDRGGGGADSKDLVSSLCKTSKHKPPQSHPQDQQGLCSWAATRTMPWEVIGAARYIALEAAKMLEATL